MKQKLNGWTATKALALALLLNLAGCGGGSDPAPIANPPGQPATVQEAIAAASTVPDNDIARTPGAAFSVLQAAGVSPVVVNSPPTVNFTVFADGQVKQGLKITDVSVVIAKLVPGTGGEPDQWQTYTHRTRAAAAFSATGNYTDAVKATLSGSGTPAHASRTTAYTDPKQTDPAKLATQLVWNADGYYTYTFSTDITNEAATLDQDGLPVKYEPGRTHRVAVQVKYTNAAGEVQFANPYFDFTIDAATGKALPVSAAQTRKMTDVSSCNSCHEKLALHGGGRVDTQYCVTCHNTGSVDANSGNSLNLSTMVHKIHAAKLLKSQLGSGGEIYTIRADDFSEVGFPQDLRNCTKCHSKTDATPQGDNWKTAVSKPACLTCHASKPGSSYDTNHTQYSITVNGAAGTAATLTNAQCKDCHRVGSNIAPERVHWNQNEENAAKYRMVIDSAAFDAATRNVTVQYHLDDPTASNLPYDLVTSDCASTTVPTCSNTTRFGNLRFYVAYQNLVGQLTSVTEFSAYNNGGNGVNGFAYKGVNNGYNVYTLAIPLPPDSATAVAAGTARVVSIGQVKEPQLQVKAAADPRPEVVPRVLVNTVVQHTYKDFAISGPLTPRRVVVGNDKCNACHGALGTTSGANTLANAFHGGARNTVEACVICHDANRGGSGNLMTNGMNLYEPYQFKRMIHGIHGNSKRSSPFTHGNKVVGAFNLDGTSATGGAPLAADVENYAAEVAWPGVGINCNACHLNNSYKQDLGQVGTLVFKDPNVTDPLLWRVISPKAATCTACHDTQKAIDHVQSNGGASFGTLTQGQIAGLPRENCEDCHASGGFKGVDLVHNQK